MLMNVVPCMVLSTDVYQFLLMRSYFCVHRSLVKYLLSKDICPVCLTQTVCILEVVE